MFPVICKIGPVTLYSYGLMLSLAVLVAGWLLARDANERLGIKRDDVFDLVFWVVLLGIVGARLFYVVLNWKTFLTDPLEVVMLQKGGLAWQGSLVAGLLVGIYYLKKKGIPLYQFLDLAAPYIALGQAIGRIGCLLNGCCFGKPVDWGIYSSVFEARLHPTQIYMSCGQIAIFLLLRYGQARSKVAGQIFVWYLGLSAVERFVIEFFRGDHELYWGLSIFQYVCIGIFIASLMINRTLVERKKFS